MTRKPENGGVAGAGVHGGGANLRQGLHRNGGEEGRQVEGEHVVEPRSALAVDLKQKVFLIRVLECSVLFEKCFTE